MDKIFERLDTAYEELINGINANVNRDRVFLAGFELAKMRKAEKEAAEKKAKEAAEVKTEAKPQTQNFNHSYKRPDKR